MAFHKKPPKFDLGETPLENLFIEEFMPMANGTYVKVFLLGYKYACDHHEIGNREIASRLSLSIEDVHNAWLFWESKHLIERQLRSDDPHDYDVTFISLRQSYIDSNYVSRQKETAGTLGEMKVKESDKFFKKIAEIMDRTLIYSGEQMKIYNWKDQFGASEALILKAFEYAVKEKNNKNLRYIEAIVRNWIDAGLSTPTEVSQYLERTERRQLFYAEVYRTLGYGRKGIAAGDREIVDKWLDDFGFAYDAILLVLKEASKKTANVNMNYMDRIVTDLHAQGRMDPDAIAEHFTRGPSTDRKPAPNRAPNRFHNFEKRKAYSNDELETILGVKKGSQDE